MGKSKVKKISVQRNNPVGIPSISSLMLEADTFDSARGPSYFEAVLDKIKSPSPEERDAGLFSLEESCSSKSVLDELVRGDILTDVIPLLLDSTGLVRLGAGRVLGKLALNPTVCDVLIRKDIMTPLVVLFKQNYVEDWKPKYHGKQNKNLDNKSAVFMGAVNLLWKLCENNPRALEIFNKEDIFPVLIKCLNVDTYGLAISCLSAECLLSVTENNKTVESYKEQLEGVLQQILIRTLSDEEKNDTDWIMLQTTTVGILMNLREANLLIIPPATFSMSMKILATAVSLDRCAAVTKIADEIKVEFDEKVDDLLYEHLKRVSSIFSFQKLALMILANLLAEDDDENTQEDESEGSEDLNEDWQNDEMECDENMTVGLIPEVYEVIKGENLVEIIFEKVLTTLPVAVTQKLAYHSCAKGISQDWDELRYTALLFLQNLIGCSGVEELVGFDLSKKIWASLFQVLAEEVNKDVSEHPRKHEIIEAVTSAYRAIMQKWVEEKVLVPLEQDKASLEIVFQLLDNIYKSVTVGKIRINIVKILGSFGFLATTTKITDISLLLVENVGEFLINCLSEPMNDDHLPVAAEALDTIYDVFAEDDYNTVLKKLEIIKKLQVFSPVYKKFVDKKSKLDLGEHKAIVQTSKTNLTRFIRYKLKHGCA